MKESAADGNGGIYCLLEVESGGCTDWYKYAKDPLKRIVPWHPDVGIADLLVP